ncbi:MAG: ribosome biogenesis GTPase Der [Candidatus Sericytochromatia bacterium]|nr:ribosome biogenesis GTPase Der [Candidatus Tanganyikabacteria bacterium]
MNLPIVAIVGRPNVGKSTLLNRFVGSREAIVHGEEGVTRDRLYARVEWCGRQFLAVDTGGIVPGTDDDMLAQVADQARLAIAEADLVLFVVDGKAGRLPADDEIAHLLRKSRKPVLVVVNKCDRYEDFEQVLEFHALGLGQPWPVSGVHGTGTGDMLDAMLVGLPVVDAHEEDDSIRIAVVGRPNAGKSSLVNRLIGEDRMIVSPVSGTTRDAIDTAIEHDGRRFWLVDTAGIRRKSKVDYGVEQFSVVRALKALERADVVVLVMDGTMGVTDQDKRLAEMAVEGGKGLVLVVNKWDLVPKDQHTMEPFRRDVLAALPHADFAPVVFISALTGQRALQVLDTAIKVADENGRRITTGVLNEVMSEATAMQPAPTRHGRRLKVYYAQQGPTHPPTFILFCNEPELSVPSYTRYLEHRMRDAFGFVGVPIRFIYRPRRERRER